MTYLVTRESNGAPLRSFAPADYPAGAKGALISAGIFARRYARDNDPCILTGPALTPRRYARPYLRRNPAFPYRLQAPCGHFSRHPHSTADRCRECFREQGQTDQQKSAVAAANRKRAARP